MANNLFDLDFSRWGIILLNLIPAFINLKIFIYVIIFTPKNRTNFAFASFVLLLGFWQLGEGLMRLSTSMEIAHEWFRIAGVFSLFVIPFGIIFILNYSKIFWKTSSILFFVVVFLPLLLCLVLITARLDSYIMMPSAQWYWIANPQPTIATSIVYTWVSLLGLLMLVLLWSSYFKERKDNTRRKPLLLLALGFTLPFAGGVTGEAIFPLVLGMDDVPLITPLFTIFSIAALIAIKKYKLLDYSPKHHWDSIVEAMSEGLLIVNNQDEIMYANKNFCETMGYECDEIIGKVANELFLDTLEDKNLLKIKNEERKNDLSSGYEIKLKTKSGEKIWVRISGSPYLDDYGNIIGSIGIQTDINSLKKAESRFRALVENADDIISMTDKEGRFIYASPAIEKVTGFTIKELIGSSIFDLMHADQHAESKRVLEELERSPGLTVPRFNRFLHKDGHYVWVEGTVTNLLHDANVEAIVSNYHDITERKEAEEKIIKNEMRYRALVENGADAMVILGVDGSPTYVSPSIKRVLGYTEEEALQLNMFSVIYPEDIPEVQRVMEETLLNPGVSIQGYTGRLLHKDGSWRWYESTITNLLHDPSINGLVDNFREVTERKTAELQKEFDRNNLQALINNTRDLLWSVGTDFRLITSNERFDEMVTYMSGEALVKGMNVLAIGFPEKQLNLFREFYERAFAGETFMEVVYSELPVEIWSEISFNPIRKGDTVVGTACYSHDITERKKSERLLHASETLIKESEAHLTEAQRLAKMGSWNFDIHDDKLTWSEELYNVFDTDKHTFLETHASFLHLVDPEYRELARQTSKYAQETGEPFTIEYNVTTAKGEKRVIREHGYGKKNAKGEIIKLFGTAQDITSGKKAEHAITDSNERYELATKATNDILWDWNIVTGKIYRSDNYFEQFGYRPSSENIFDDSWADNVHAEDKDRALNGMLDKVNNPEALVWECDYRFYKQNGELTYIRDKGHIVRGKDGVALRMVGAMSDITEQKLSEDKLLVEQKRLKDAQAITHVGNWEIDFSKNISHWSDEAYRIYGIEPGEHKLSFEDWIRYVHPDDLETFKEEIKSSQETLSDFSHHHRIVRMDGIIRYLVSESKYEFDSSGKPVGLYGVVYDVTEQKRSALQLQNLLDVTNEQNKRLQNFAYIVSHNIRSHSANIIGLVDVFRDCRNEQERAELFGMLKTSTDKLGETIENLNGIITIQNTTSQEMTEMNLHEEVNKTLHAINSLVLTTNTTVHNAIKGDVLIKAIPSYLESILLNLLSNSIKYRSPDRPCIIEVSAVRSREHIVLSIQDNGIGIDMDKNGAKIFGMYKTFHDNEDAKGLGLFITKNQVESMHGKIEVESLLGLGSVFKVYFNGNL